jgi:DNA-binding transcriptional LysR family regulator
MVDSFVLAFVPGVTPSKWVGVWKQRMPKVDIDVRPSSLDDGLQSLLSGEAHVALLRLPFDNAGLSVIPLYADAAVVVAPKDHPIAEFESLTLAELAGENVLDGEWADAVELVAANVGIALMPQSIARLHARKDVVARLVADAPATQVALAWVTERTTPLIEEFVGIVRGRTANSSRGIAEANEKTTRPVTAARRHAGPARPAKPAKRARRPR